MPIVRTSRGRETLVARTFGEGGRVQSVGGVPIGFHRDGELFPTSSCNCELKVFNLIQYIGEGVKLARALFSLDSLFEACMTGSATTFQGAITKLVTKTNSLCSASQNRRFVISATNRPFSLDDVALRRLHR